MSASYESDLSFGFTGISYVIIFVKKHTFDVAINFHHEVFV